MLGDWYATLLHTRRAQFVLAISRATLLPIVVTARDQRSFPARVASRLAEVLDAYGVPVDWIEREWRATSDVVYARTDDRSNVGVLTELQRLLHGELEYFPDATLTELSLRLAQTPIVARHVFPEDETCRLFGVSSPRHRERTSAIERGALPRRDDRLRRRRLYCGEDREAARGAVIVSLDDRGIVDKCLRSQIGATA